jgi:hypothetical protein
LSEELLLNFFFGDLVGLQNGINAVLDGIFGTPE